MKKVVGKGSEDLRLYMYILFSITCTYLYICIISGAKMFIYMIGQSCTDQVYVMAFTGGSTNALTTDPPSVELRVGNEVRSVTLPTVTGLEYQRNKGDIWAINMTEFGFTDTCIRQGDIDGIAIVEGGTDGWLIDSIVIILQDEDGLFSLLSSEIGVNTWIDGNGGQERRRLDLNLN